MNRYYQKFNASHSFFPTDIRSILSQLPCFQNKQLSKTIKARLEKDNLVKNWVKIVGPKLAEHTKPLSIRDQKVAVIVDEPKWMSVMEQIQKELTQKINEFIKLSSKQSISGNNQKRSETLLQKRKHSYTIKLTLGKIFSSVYPSPTVSIIEPDLDKEKKLKIEHILNHIKNNEKLQQVFYNIFVKYYQYNQNVKVNTK